MYVAVLKSVLMNEGISWQWVHCLRYSRALGDRALFVKKSS